MRMLIAALMALLVGASAQAQTIANLPPANAAQATDQVMVWQNAPNAGLLHTGRMPLPALLAGICPAGTGCAFVGPVTLPSWTTTGRPATTTGTVGINTTTGFPEVAVGGAFHQVITDQGGQTIPSLTLSGSGTALTVTNDAVIDGNLTGLQSVSITNGAASLTVGGAASAFRFAGVNLYAGAQSTFTLSGTQTFPQQAAFWSDANLAGTYSTAGGIAVQSQIVVPSDILMAPTASVSWLDVSGNLNAGFSGNRAAISAELAINGTSGAVANDGERQWQAQILTAQISANQGGTAPTSGSSAGFVYSGGDQLWCYSGATDLSGCVGREIDVGIQTGASAAERLGLSIFSFLNLQGNDRDDGIMVGVSTGAPGWKEGMVFSSASGATYGTLIGYDTGPGAATVSASYGINWTGVTFSTASLALPGFTVDPTGNITIATPATGTAASYACFTSAGKLISSATAC